MKKQNKNQNPASEAPQTETTVKPIHEKRALLKKLSQQVKDFVRQGVHKTINAALINEVYKNETHTTFQSFAEWQAAGYRVRKGEKAFLLWGAPTDKAEDAQSEDKFFPIKFIFSNAQVEKISQEVQA